jgi:hypothetical protein
MRRHQRRHQHHKCSCPKIMIYHPRHGCSGRRRRRNMG